MTDSKRWMLVRILNSIQSALCRVIQVLAEKCPPSPPVVRLRWWFTSQSYVEGNAMRLTNEQRVLVTVIAVTLAGNAAPIDGEVQFASSDPGVARIERVSANSAYIFGENPGAAQITATFDADLGEGVRTITNSGAVEVVQAEAVTGSLQFGDPELAVVVDQDQT